MSHHNGGTVSDVRLSGGGRRTLHGSAGRGPAGWGGGRRMGRRPADQTVDTEATR